MDAWVLWLIPAVILAVGELGTTGLFLGPFAGGAAIATLVAAAGAGTAIQWVAFLVVAVALMGGLRPLARSQLRRPPLLRTGTFALVGRTATVLERIANDEGVGRVRVDGEIWSARTYCEDEVIEPGTRVQVIEIRGATALVSE